MIEFHCRDVEHIIEEIKQKGKNHMFGKYIFKIENRLFFSEKFARCNPAFAHLPAKQSEICFICGEEASHNFPDMEPYYCKIHMVAGMENVVSKRCCEVTGCNTPASYGDIKKTRCEVHKTENMENKNFICKIPGCKLKAQFADKTRCVLHL